MPFALLERRGIRPEIEFPIEWNSRNRKLETHQHQTKASSRAALERVTEEQSHIQQLLRIEWLCFFCAIRDTWEEYDAQLWL